MVTQVQEIAPAAATGTPPAPGAAAGARAPRRRSEAASPARKGVQAELRRFAAEHPDGWGHDEWIQLLGGLAAAGHDTADADAIGLGLERERLTLALALVPGLGARRRATILDRYPRLWDLRHADPAEIAALPGMNAGLARRILDELA